VARALRLEYLTLGWNLIEAAIALWAARAAASTALLGFGVDSCVESASAAILVWRLRAERGAAGAEAVEGLERRARRLVAVSLFLLAAYVAYEAVTALAGGERPRPSPVGMALTAVSLLAMYFLARAKRRAARALDSRALQSDAFQTTACMWLSATTLAGVGLNAVLGWWWADPAAALAIAVLLVREGREAWRGEACSC